MCPFHTQNNSIHESVKMHKTESERMGIPSLTNWLSDSIDDGDQPASLYIAELAQFPDFLTLGYYKTSNSSPVDQDNKIKRLRYETQLDQQILSELVTTPLKDCWLIEQFLLYQLKDYKQIIPELQQAEWPGFQETLHIPELGREHFIEWIAESIQSILVNRISGYKTCLDSLITTSRQRELYFKRQNAWNVSEQNQ
mgnify:CR=1 FL=1